MSAYRVGTRGSKAVQCAYPYDGIGEYAEIKIGEVQHAEIFLHNDSPKVTLDGGSETWKKITKYLL